MAFRFPQYLWALPPPTSEINTEFIGNTIYDTIHQGLKPFIGHDPETHQGSKDQVTSTTRTVPDKSATVQEEVVSFYHELIEKYGLSEQEASKLIYSIWNDAQKIADYQLKTNTNLIPIFAPVAIAACATNPACVSGVAAITTAVTTAIVTSFRNTHNVVAIDDQGAIIWQKKDAASAEQIEPVKSNTYSDSSAEEQKQDIYASDRTEAEYRALQRKNIIVNSKMSYPQDAVDGEFLSKLDAHEFRIDAATKKVIVLLEMDSDGKSHYKEYDLAKANYLRKTYGAANGNEGAWNYNQYQAISKLSSKSEIVNAQSSIAADSSIFNWGGLTTEFDYVKSGTNILKAAGRIAAGTFTVVEAALGILLVPSQLGNAENDPNFITNNNKQKDSKFTPLKEKDKTDGLIHTPVPEALPELPGFTPHTPDKADSIESFPVPEALPNLPGFTPYNPDRHSHTESFPIHESDHDMGALYNVKIENGKVDLGDLREDHEGGEHRGHTIERHSGKDIEFLKSREIKSASSYPDEVTAHRVTQEILQHHVKDLEEWINNAKPGEKKSFQASFEKPVGYSIKTGETSVTPKNGATVWIKKTESEVKIITSYPID